MDLFLLFALIALNHHEDKNKILGSVKNSNDSFIMQLQIDVNYSQVLCNVALITRKKNSIAFNCTVDLHINEQSAVIKYLLGFTLKLQLLVLMISL